LGAPAADRPITFNVTGTPQRFIAAPSGGYSECAVPACDPTAKITEPGTCDNLRQFASLADAPKNFAMTDVRCDGAFAVHGLDFGSGGCPPAEGQPSPCAGKSIHRIYWRATDNGWSIIAWDDTAGCGTVLMTPPTSPRRSATTCPRSRTTDLPIPSLRPL
jgi:hypothetical protein